MMFGECVTLIERTRNQEIFSQKLADYPVDSLWILVFTFYIF